MGRTINGSYAEYTCVPASNVASIESDLSWAELAVIPETYATAWTCLFRNLELKAGQTILIRGATSSFGQAAVNMAVNAVAKVIATTRNRDRFPILEALGVQGLVIQFSTSFETMRIVVACHERPVHWTNYSEAVLGNRTSRTIPPSRFGSSL
ncbi:hypothetical protein V1522DRAFT_280811 [Lipomyces starkeyi]